jgi:hypothetical protein
MQAHDNSLNVDLIPDEEKDPIEESLKESLKFLKELEQKIEQLREEVRRHKHLVLCSYALRKGIDKNDGSLLVQAGDHKVEISSWEFTYSAKSALNKEREKHAAYIADICHDITHLAKMANLSVIF